jgi:hypothetical protein
MRKSPSKSSLSGSTNSSTLAPSSSSTLSVNIPSEEQKSLPAVPESGSLSAMPMIQAVNAANAALMERTPFAIDDAKDDDDDDDDDLGDVDNDDRVLDEVCSFFELLFQCYLSTIAGGCFP